MIRLFLLAFFFCTIAQSVQAEIIVGQYHSFSAGCSDPVAGLTADNTNGESNSLNNADFGDDETDMTFHFNANFDASPNGAIIEMGGRTYGMGVWANGTEICAAASDGQTFSTSADTVVLCTSLASVLNDSADIVVAFRPAPTGKIAFWINNCKVAEESTTGGGAMDASRIFGTNGGGFGGTNGAETDVMVSTDYDNTFNGVLTIYDGEVPADF